MRRSPARSIFPPLSSIAGERVRTASRVLGQWIEANTPIQLRDLLLPLLVQARHSHCLWTDSLGFWDSSGSPLWLPRFHFQRTRVLKSRIQIGIFAGIHGDEPAGILALMDFLRELDENPELGKDYEIWIYPVCNPGGCLDRTRFSRTGSDLNREFWSGSLQPEIRLLEREIRERQFQGIISLHSDDTSPGFYGYARGNVLASGLLMPALEAAERVQSRDSRSFIDGFKAFNGMVHDAWEGILSAPPEQSPRPFEIILESPALTPLADQRRAFCLALGSLLTEYRKFIAFGGDL